MSVINTNITSMIGQQNLSKSQNALATSMERLSSGLRINSAKDDAAGQAIANRMSSQITGLAQAQRNANDGISVAQTAEGGLNQINDNLQRIRELSVQAENGTNSSEDLNSIQNEINQRLEEIDRISRETDFNGTKVLGANEDASDPTKRTISIQVGAQDGQSIELKLEQINRDTLNLTGFNVDGTGETPNAEATEDMLKLASPTAVNQIGDVTEYVLSETNNPATTADVLAKATQGDAIIIDGTTYTKTAEDNTFSYGESYSTNPTDALTAAMQPDLGETTKATVNIGGKETDITIASDGAITATASQKTLYLDSTGNLTENTAGSPPAANITNLAASLASGSGNSIEIEGGATYTTQAGYTDLTDSSGTASTTAATAADITASGGTAAAIDVTLNGNTSTVNIDNTGAVTNAASDPLYLDENNNLTTDSAAADGTAYTTATATSLAEAVSATSGSLEITDANAGGAQGEIYTGNGRVVNATGLTTTSSGVNDALKAGTGGPYTLTLNDGDAAAEQDIQFTVTAGEVTAIDFNGGAGTDAIASGTVNVTADETLTDAATTDTSYFVQENDNVTNASGQRIYQDSEGNFTTKDVTIGERTPDALGQLDKALSRVDALRSDLGAIQNRLESSIENLSTTETNISAARSRIEDADYAVEVANMTRAQILQQAGTSVLAQANQIPQSVLSLLG